MTTSFMIQLVILKLVKKAAKKWIGRRKLALGVVLASCPEYCNLSSGFEASFINGRNSSYVFKGLTL